MIEFGFNLSKLIITPWYFILFFKKKTELILLNFLTPMIFGTYNMILGVLKKHMILGVTVLIKHVQTNSLNLRHFFISPKHTHTPV
jgi:hypothetical protein